MRSDSAKVFIDASCGVLRAVLWHESLDQPHCVNIHLSPTTPLSDELPKLWDTLFSPLHHPPSAFEKHVYTLTGPGPLTSLRVLFSHLIALATAHRNTAFYTLPTPQWYQLILTRTQSLTPQSFIHQVGRFAFIIGTIQDISSYKTIHIREEAHWPPLLTQLSPPILLIAPITPDSLQHTNHIRIDTTLPTPPDVTSKTLPDFQPIPSLSALKPIQP